VTGREIYNDQVKRLLVAALNALGCFGQLLEQFPIGDIGTQPVLGEVRKIGWLKNQESCYTCAVQPALWWEWHSACKMYYHNISGLIWSKGAITSKIQHAIKLKTGPARLAQLLQLSLAFCFSLQPMTAHWTVHRHWLQAKAGLVLSFVACFILLVIAP